MARRHEFHHGLAGHVDLDGRAMTARDHFEVIVVGAGPGGFAAALAAARRGMRVLVLDRAAFPRDKVCGDAITPLGMTMLAQLGVLDLVRSVADSHVPRIYLSPSSGEPPRTLDTPVLVVRRRVLDATLLDVIRPLVEVRENHGVDRILWHDGQVCGVAGMTGQGSRFQASAAIVIGADGASSTIARLTGCRGSRANDLLIATRGYYRGVAQSSHDLEFHFLPELGGGYLWIFPAGAGCHNVGMGGAAGQIRGGMRGLRELWSKAVAASPLKQRFAAAQPPRDVAGGQIPFGGTTQQIYGPGLMLVGDAAGLADAFWGDGIDTALVSGTLAGTQAAAAIAAGDVTAERLASYRHSVLRVLGKKLALGLERQRATALPPSPAWRPPDHAVTPSTCTARMTARPSIQR